MKELVLWLLCFIVVYLVYLILIINNKKKLAKYRNSTEIKYFKNKFNINIDKIGMKKLANIISLANAFIISTTVSIVSLLDSIIIVLLLSIFVLIPLIIVVYNIIGRMLSNKYGKQEK